jgi:hypothetical protein
VCGWEVEASVDDHLSKSCGGLSECEWVEFDLGKADFAEGAEEVGQVGLSLFAHGVELNAVEKVGMRGEGGCREAEDAAGGGGESGETEEVATCRHLVFDAAR